MLYYNTTMTSQPTSSDPEKILAMKDIQKLKKNFTGKKIVLTGGCFDLFHYGHLFFLNKAKSAGDLLVIALESDEFILKSKHRQPVHTQKQRAEILSHIDIVDVVLMLPLFHSNEDYFNMTRMINPKVIAVTKGDPILHYKKAQAETVGARVVEVDLLKEFSSSNIMKYAAVFGD